MVHPSFELFFYKNFITVIYHSFQQNDIASYIQHSIRYMLDKRRCKHCCQVVRCHFIYICVCCYPKKIRFELCKNKEEIWFTYSGVPAYILRCRNGVLVMTVERVLWKISEGHCTYVLQQKSLVSEIGISSRNSRVASMSRGCTLKVMSGTGRTRRYNFNAPVTTWIFGYFSSPRSAISPSGNNIRD